VLGSIKRYGELVMFPHTLFSLPFGVISMMIAAGGFPPLKLTFWIIVALISARTGANALNRLVDKDIDARNPRTKGRHIPQGSVSVREALLLSAGCFVVLVIAAYMIRPVCVFLLPVPLSLMLLYSFTKRFTWACHLMLGAACACAPVGAWIAVTGELSWAVITLGAAVMLWVAGFDIIYGVLDIEHDREEGLHSIPSAFGARNAFVISAAFHTAAVMLLIYTGILVSMGWIYFLGIALTAGLLLYEHIIISPDDNRKIPIASYLMNQIVSSVFLIFSGADMLIK
jgi:4-hydroxybenzoate polyprenyltransferase